MARKLSYLMYDPVPTLDELSHRMGRLAAFGYGGVELSATHPLDYPVEAMAELAKKHNLPIVSLLSGWSYPNEGLCLSSPDADVRTRAVERLIGYVSLAASLGSILVVGLMQGLRRDEPNEERANDRISEGLRRVAAAAHDRGVAVVIEPVNHLQVGFNHTAAEAAALAERVSSPALGYMLDTIHMNIEERSVIETIREHGPRIRHFHLCETNGGPFGTGGLDFPRVLAALDATGYAHFASVKVYRKVAWEEAARSAAEHLTACGVR